MFTTDIIDIIQSSIGKHKDICRNVEMVVGLDLIPFDAALELVDQIVNVEKLLQSQGKTRDSLRKNISHLFPTRRRVIGMVLGDPKLLLNDIETAFISNWIKFVNEVKEGISTRVQTKTSNDIVDKDILVQVLVQKDYSNILGRTIMYNQPLSSSLIGSGLARPIYVYDSTYFEFDVTDPIFHEVAKSILILHYSKSNLQPFEILQTLLSVPQSKAEFWQTAFFLILSQFSGKTIRDNLPLYLAIEETKKVERVKNEEWKDWSKLLDCKFNITSSSTCNDFYRKYKDTEWAKTALTKEVANINTSGDCLYFYCLEHFTEKINEHSSEKFGDLIDGLYYLSSDTYRPDGICFNFNPEPICLLVSNKVQNCARKTFTEMVNSGKESIDFNFLLVQTYHFGTIT